MRCAAANLFSGESPSRHRSAQLLDGSGDLVQLLRDGNEGVYLSSGYLALRVSKLEFLEDVLCSLLTLVSIHLHARHRTSWLGRMNPGATGKPSALLGEQNLSGVQRDERPVDRAAAEPQADPRTEVPLHVFRRVEEPRDAVRGVAAPLSLGVTSCSFVP
jgi:hypothetical protein